MDISTFITVSACCLIVICSMVCAGYMSLLLREGYGQHERKLQRGALIFFLMFAGIFTAAILYKWFPRLYVIFSPIIGACLCCSWTVFYYMVFTITGEGKNRRFPRIYVILPLILPVVLAAWMPFVPLEVPLGIVREFREMNPEWPVFSRVYTLLMPAFLLFSGWFLGLSLIKLSRYRRSLPKRKREESRYRLRWIYAAVILICTTLLFGIIAMLISPRAVYSSYGFAIVAIAITFMDIMLLYNLLLHNYPPPGIKINSRVKQPQADTPIRSVEKKETPAYPLGKIKMAQLSRKEFDHYFRQEKPYLDPQLKLTSLAEVLGVNRIELSKFVNTTYKVNFNVFVNHWRFEEVERLRKLDKNKDVTLKSLIPQAGFASYNSFMRARQQAEGDSRNENESSQ